MRKLDKYLASEHFNVECDAKALQIPADKLLDAIILNEKAYQAQFARKAHEQEEKERSNFRPYFYCINERKAPQPIFADNLTHYMRFVF